MKGSEINRAEAAEAHIIRLALAQGAECSDVHGARGESKPKALEQHT